MPTYLSVITNSNPSQSPLFSQLLKHIIRSYNGHATNPQKCEMPRSHLKSYQTEEIFKEPTNLQLLCCLKHYAASDQLALLHLQLLPSLIPAPAHELWVVHFPLVASPTPAVFAFEQVQLDSGSSEEFWCKMDQSLPWKDSKEMTQRFKQ